MLCSAWNTIIKLKVPAVDDEPRGGLLLDLMRLLPQPLLQLREQFLIQGEDVSEVAKNLRDDFPAELWTWRRRLLRRGLTDARGLHRFQEVLIEQLQALHVCPLRLQQLHRNEPPLAHEGLELLTRAVWFRRRALETSLWPSRFWYIR